MSSLITPDYYETLELDRKATQEDIKEAYRNLSLRFNPKRATQSTEAYYDYKFQNSNPYFPNLKKNLRKKHIF